MLILVPLNRYVVCGSVLHMGLRGEGVCSALGEGTTSCSGKCCVRVMYVEDRRSFAQKNGIEPHFWD